MRFLRTGRLFGVAGLAALAVFAFTAAPAGATLVCPAGTTNPKYCSRHISISVTIVITGSTVKVTIKVTDPHVTAELLHNGKVIKVLLNRNVSGKFHLKFKKPKKNGIYVLRVTAKVDNVSKTVNKKFRVGPKPRATH